MRRIARTSCTSRTDGSCRASPSPPWTPASPVLWTHVDFLWTCRGGKLLDARAHPCGAKPGAACASCYDDIDAERALVRQVREELVGAMARGVSLHHAPCPFMAEHVVGAGAPRDRVLTAPYGVPASMRAVEKTPSADGRLRLGFIGRWNRIKGLSVLLGAIERLGESAPVALTLYGEREVWNTDTYAMEIEARARRLANVRVAGRLDPSRLADAHRELDALVVPSVWAENSPVTILEALALGTPVVCSDEAGMTNLIRDGANGLVFSSGDAQALAEKLEILARDGDLRTHLRAGARCVRTVEEGRGGIRARILTGAAAGRSLEGEHAPARPAAALRG
ncbi:MAG: glycosyltransferase [Deltaproteobacteria bacterium]|nr:glycosyltransferase [Deltaproteobacteria bacterium]